MTTIIEKDSPLVPLLVLVLMFLTLVGGGLGLAYMWVGSLPEKMKWPRMTKGSLI